MEMFDVSKKESSVVEEPEYIDRGEYNKEFLQLMHFEKNTKNAKASKISQSEAIEMLLDEREKVMEEATMKNPLNVFYKKEIKHREQERR